MNIDITYNRATDLGGEDGITEDIAFKIKRHRLKALMESRELKDQATDYEAMVYLSTEGGTPK